MNEQPRIGVTIPHGEGDADGGVLPWPAIRDFVTSAEAHGLDSAWIFDHLVMRFPDEPQAGLHEGWTILSALAGVTGRIALGSIVMCTSFRNPALQAKMAATLDDVSGGRLILGLGAGWHDPEYEAFGYPIDHRGGRFAEAIEIIAPLLRGKRVTLEGRFEHVHDAELVPPPARLDIPILIAAKGPRLMDLTARHAQLWNAAWFGEPDERLATRRADLAAALDRAGRDPATMIETVGLRVAPAGSAAAEPSEGPQPWRGTEDDLARLFETYERLGIGHLIVWPVPATQASLDWLGAAVRRYRSAG